MIRNSRKKSSKTKLFRKEHCNNNNNGKKENSMDNNRIDSINGRRFVVNKSLGETLLHRSARNNRLDVVRLCLESDACDVNARDNAGYTPLHECSSRGNLEIARLLLQHSADVNASAAGGIRYVLFVHSKIFKSHILSLLIITIEFSARPLHDAIENDHIEIVRLLLSYGADPRISTYSGTTPLQLSRSKAMSKFLQGFYSDISTDRSMIDMTNVWKFNSHHHHSLVDSGFDIFADLSSDDNEDLNADDDDDGMEYEFEASCRPLLNLYTFLHKPDQW
ncbi:BCL-6 corepressor-like protein [Euroglyphus maynei]|uniref:BCL-6 corepressor-like protein n=1 Tax=Euroglyphus maynei TaxID=6958 RepID=A0A1Y3BRP4_EURMA|nr:BCL-6 corepressor-like protein [Euroglyphus maynei]